MNKLKAGKSTLAAFITQSSQKTPSKVSDVPRHARNSNQIFLDNMVSEPIDADADRSAITKEMGNVEIVGDGSVEGRSRRRSLMVFDGSAIEASFVESPNSSQVFERLSQFQTLSSLVAAADHENEEEHCPTPNTPQGQSIRDKNSIEDAGCDTTNANGEGVLGEPNHMRESSGASSRSTGCAGSAADAHVVTSRKSQMLRSFQPFQQPDTRRVSFGHYSYSSSSRSARAICPSILTGNNEPPEANAITPNRFNYNPSTLAYAQNCQLNYVTSHRASMSHVSKIDVKKARRSDGGGVTAAPFSLKRTLRRSSPNLLQPSGGNRDTGGCVGPSVLIDRASPAHSPNQSSGARPTGRRASLVMPAHLNTEMSISSHNHPQSIYAGTGTGANAYHVRSSSAYSAYSSSANSTINESRISHSHHLRVVSNDSYDGIDMSNRKSGVIIQSLRSRRSHSRMSNSASDPDINNDIINETVESQHKSSSSSVLDAVCGDCLRRGSALQGVAGGSTTSGQSAGQCSCPRRFSDASGQLAVPTTTRMSGWGDNPLCVIAETDDEDIKSVTSDPNRGEKNKTSPDLFDLPVTSRPQKQLLSALYTVRGKDDVRNDCSESDIDVVDGEISSSTPHMVDGDLCLRSVNSSKELVLGLSPTQNVVGQTITVGQLLSQTQPIKCPKTPSTPSGRGVGPLGSPATPIRPSRTTPKCPKKMSQNVPKMGHLGHFGQYLSVTSSSLGRLLSLSSPSTPQGCLNSDSCRNRDRTPDSLNNSYRVTDGTITSSVINGRTIEEFTDEDEDPIPIALRTSSGPFPLSKSQASLRTFDQKFDVPYIHTTQSFDLSMTQPPTTSRAERTRRMAQDHPIAVIDRLLDDLAGLAGVEFEVDTSGLIQNGMKWSDHIEVINKNLLALKCIGMQQLYPDHDIRNSSANVSPRTPQGDDDDAVGSFKQINSCQIRVKSKSKSNVLFRNSTSLSVGNDDDATVPTYPASPTNINTTAPNIKKRQSSKSSARPKKTLFQTLTSLRRK